MGSKLGKWLFLLAVLVGGVSCTLNGKAPNPLEDGPRFGKVLIQYTDTTTPEMKAMIYRLDTFYKREIAAGFNGSVLIGYKGKVLYERYYGFSDKELGARWAPETQSQLASTSKTLTSGAILLLYDKGLLQLDDNVKKYIPEFPYDSITIRLLLNHRSGLPDYIHFAAKPKNKLFLNNDDVVKLFATLKPKLLFKPNTHFKYSNSNFALLATVVERVSGYRFDYFMRRFIFTPLGMDCTVVHDPEKESTCTQAYCYKSSWLKEPDMHHDGVWGDKGVYSSVRDLYKWDQALYAGKLIKPSTLEEAFRPYSFEAAGVKNYGLGWRMLNYPDGQKIVYHNGWWHGNNTCFYRFIQDNFTIIILGNKFNKNIYRQPQKIFNLIMNKADDGFGTEGED
jgi:CubicO group peptidase (beta-lactamase class C family)